MKFTDMSEYYRTEFVEKCSCGKEFSLFSTWSNYPEYQHEVYIKCPCGEFVEFILPVN